MPDSPSPGKPSRGKRKRLRKARALEEDAAPPPPPEAKPSLPQGKPLPQAKSGMKPPPRSPGGQPPPVRPVTPAAGPAEGPPANPLGIQTEPPAAGAAGGASSTIAYRRKKSPLPLIIVLLVVLGGGAGVGIYFGMQPAPEPVATADGGAAGADGTGASVTPGGSDGNSNGGTSDGGTSDGGTTDGGSPPFNPGGTDGGSPPFNPNPGGNSGGGPQEATYRGKTVAQWTDQLLRGTNHQVDDQATAAFARGLPEPPDRSVLLAALKDADKKVRIQALGALQIYHGEVPAAELLVALEDEDVAVRQAAVYLSGLQPEIPREIVAALLQTAGDDVSETDLASGLAAADDAAVTLLIEALDSQEPAARKAALRGLARRNKGRALAHLERFCASPVDELRLAAIEELGRLGRAAAPAVDTLAELLDDEREPTRVAAAVALSRIDPNREFPAAALTREVDGRATLQYAGAMTPESVPELIAMIEGESPQKPAIAALGKLGPLAQPAAPALLRVIREVGWDVADDAAQALAELGPAANEVVPELLKIAGEETEETDFAPLRAALVLGKLGATDAIPLLTEMLDGEDRMLAVEALGWMGPAAAETSPALRELARTGGLTADEFYQLELALGRIEPQGDNITRQRYKSILEIPEIAVPADLTVALEECIALLEAEEYDKLQADHFRLGQGGEGGSASTRARIAGAAGPLLRALRYAQGQQVRMLDGEQTALFALAVLGDEGSPGLTFARDGDRWRLTFPLPGAGLPQSVHDRAPPYHQALYQLEVMNRIRAVPGTDIERSEAESEAIENLIAMGAYVAATGGDGGPHRTAVHFAARYYYGGDVGFELLGMLTNVEVLIVDEADYLSQFALERIAELESLRYLRIPYPGYRAPWYGAWHPDGARHVPYLNHGKHPLEYFAGLRDLQVLWFDNWEPPPPHVVLLSEVASIDEIEISNLKEATYRSAGLKHLAGLSQLERLVFSGDYVPPICICDAELQELAPLKKLREVSLNEVAYISPQGVEQLAEKLPRAWVQWPHHTFP